MWWRQYPLTSSNDCNYLSLYSLSGQTSYRQISWIPEAVRLDVQMIALQFDGHLGSSAAEVPVKFQNDWRSINPNLAASRSCRKTSYRLVNIGPGQMGCARHYIHFMIVAVHYTKRQVVCGGSSSHSVHMSWEAAIKFLLYLAWISNHTITSHRFS